MRFPELYLRNITPYSLVGLVAFFRSLSLVSHLNEPEKSNYALRQAVCIVTTPCLCQKTNPRLVFPSFAVVRPLSPASHLPGASYLHTIKPFCIHNDRHVSMWCFACRYRSMHVVGNIFWGKMSAYFCDLVFFFVLERKNMGWENYVNFIANLN